MRVYRGVRRDAEKVCPQEKTGREAAAYCHDIRLRKRAKGGRTLQEKVFILEIMARGID